MGIRRLGKAFRTRYRGGQGNCILRTFPIRLVDIRRSIRHFTEVIEIEKAEALSLCCSTNASPIESTKFEHVGSSSITHTHSSPDNTNSLDPLTRLKP